MTDGRDDLLSETLPAAAAAVPHTRLVVHDDTGDYEHRLGLHHRFHHLGVDVIGGNVRRGFGGAIAAAWHHITGGTEQFVVHWEDDFLPTRPVDWVELADTLSRHTHLVQLALRRQPWNPDEIAAGGIVEQHPVAGAHPVLHDEPVDLPQHLVRARLADRRVQRGPVRDLTA